MYYMYHSILFLHNLCYTSSLILEIYNSNYNKEIATSWQLHSQLSFDYGPYSLDQTALQLNPTSNVFELYSQANLALRHGKRRMAMIGEYDFFGESMMTTNVAFRTRVATYGGPETIKTNCNWTLLPGTHYKQHQRSKKS